VRERLVELITWWVRAKRPTVKRHDLEKRIAATLRQRLLAAPAELRTMATAARPVPEVESDEAQQEAMRSLLRAHLVATSDRLDLAAGEIIPAAPSSVSGSASPTGLRHDEGRQNGCGAQALGRGEDRRANPPRRRARRRAHPPRSRVLGHHLGGDCVRSNDHDGRHWIERAHQHLFEQLEMPLPSELLDLLAEALRVWRLPVTKIEFIELRTTAALDRCRPPGDLSGLDERRRRGRQMSSLSEAQDDQTRLLGALPRVRPDAGLQAS
jgi:hypothetical protein